MVAVDTFASALELAKDDRHTPITRRRARIVAKNINLILSEARKNELDKIDIAKTQKS